MAGKIKIKNVSNVSITITVILSILCLFISIFSYRQYDILKTSMNEYIECQNAAMKLKEGSDILTKNVRLAANYADKKYIDEYFVEADLHRSRETALKVIAQKGTYTDALMMLNKAHDKSDELMQTEYYAMRLILESKDYSRENWPKELKNISISMSDEELSSEMKLEKAKSLLYSIEYENAKDEIFNDVNSAISALSGIIGNKQSYAVAVFDNMLNQIIFSLSVFSLMTITICLMMKFWIVTPLLSFNKSIKNSKPLSLTGANELQELAKTYNELYKENEERQMLMKREAEHDPLTKLLNRGSFDKILNLYLKDKNKFALIFIDVDDFKSVNDTYGHFVGDIILKKVADQLTIAFRNIDYICRIGGDEFAIIMVDMTSDLQYTIIEKINTINKELISNEENIPSVSLSVGVAFTDRENPSDSIFNDADEALYHTKRNGKNNCSFYPVKEKMRNKKGFTLGELLIVVAIIAVLVGISIPIFNKQIEKSREAKDLAEVRNAYMLVKTASIEGATANGVNFHEGVYFKKVPLKQKQEGWSTAFPLSIGEASIDEDGNAQYWQGSPRKDGTCTVSFSQKDGLLIKWDDTTYKYNTSETAFFDLLSKAYDKIPGTQTSSFGFDSQCPNSSYIPLIKEKINEDSLLNTGVWAFAGDPKAIKNGNQYLLWTSVKAEEMNNKDSVPIIVQSKSTGKFYVSETTVMQKTNGKGTYMSIIPSERSKDIENNIKGKNEYNNLEEALIAYENIVMTENKYANYREGLNDLKN